VKEKNMEFKTSHIIIGLGALVLLSQGENVRSFVEKNNQVRSQQAEFSDRIRQNRIEAREAEQLSKIALSRYRNNCILVIDQSTKKESYFQPNALVVDSKLNRTLRPGATICNRAGDTAVVSEAGTITDIARVTTPDLPQFKKLLQQRR
jgi:hypothetical protein